MDRELIPFEDNPIAEGVLICRTCNRIVRIVPAVSPHVLYAPSFHLNALLECILSYNDFFICYLCCQVLCNTLQYRESISKTYFCFICKAQDTSPMIYLKNSSRTLSGFLDIPVYNTKYVCHDCMVLLTHIICLYKIISKDLYNVLKTIRGCKYIASYVCQPMILPLIVAKPFGKLTVHDYVRNIDLVNIEFLMKSTDIYIEGRVALFSRKEITDVIMELESQRAVFECLSEMTRYVVVKFDSDSEDYEVLDNVESDYDYITDLSSISQTMKGIHLSDEEEYITANTDEIPVDWLLLDVTEDDDDVFPKIEDYQEECEEKSECNEDNSTPSFFKLEIKGKKRKRPIHQKRLKGPGEIDKNLPSCSYTVPISYSDSD